MSDTRRWTKVIRKLQKLPTHAEIEVPRDAMPSPLSAGMHRSYGEPKGQQQDYRKSLPGGTGFHVREFEDRYTAHIDSVDVDKDIVKHVIEDSPTTAIITSAIVGASLASMTDCKRDAVKGALLGGIAAIIILAIKNIRRSGS